MQRLIGIAVAVMALGISGCAARVPAAAPAGGAAKVLEIREGLASFYGKAFQGKLTASGTPFDMNDMVAAHPSYPFGTVLRVINLANGRSAEVRIQDRGPAPRIRADGVIIDLSRRAAEVLDFIREGRTRVRLEVLAWGGP